ncbi:MAG: hypothetical protein PHG55_05900, partial [Verrucomicrobiota bacterium]|nr:hypothetical protein [Verrucomicrobiota bacterium]
MRGCLPGIADIPVGSHGGSVREPTRSRLRGCGENKYEGLPIIQIIVEIEIEIEIGIEIGIGIGIEIGIEIGI